LHFGKPFVLGLKKRRGLLPGRPNEGVVLWDNALSVLRGQMARQSNCGAFAVDPV